jgi:hypothetical protein
MSEIFGNFGDQFKTLIKNERKGVLFAAILAECQSASPEWH